MPTPTTWIQAPLPRQDSTLKRLLAAALAMLTLAWTPGVAAGQQVAPLGRLSPSVNTTLEQLEALLRPSEEHATRALQAYLRHATSGRGAAPRFDVLPDSELRSLYGIGESAANGVARFFARPLSDLLLGGLPPFTCERGVVTPVQQLQEPTRATRSEIWDRLVEGDFLAVSLMLDAPVQAQGLRRDGAADSVRLALQCRMLQMAVEEVRCIHRPGAESCRQTYSERMTALVEETNALIVSDYAQEARTEFTRIRPHLANLRDWILSASDDVALVDAVESTLTQAVAGELAFRRDLAIARFLLGLDEALLTVLRVSRESIERIVEPVGPVDAPDDAIHPPFVEGARVTAQAIVLREVEPALTALRSRVYERVRQLRSYADSFESAAVAEAEEALARLEESIGGRGCAIAEAELERTRAVLEGSPARFVSRAPFDVPSSTNEVGLHLQSTPTGRFTPNGAELYDVEVYLLVQSDVLDMVVESQAEVGAASLGVPCLEDRQIAPRGELISLNISLKDMIRLADQRFVSSGRAFLDRQVRVTAGDLDRAMRALAAPIPLLARVVTAEVDDEVRNLDLIGSFAALPGSPLVEVRLSLLRDGRVASGEDLRADFEETVSAWLRVEAKTWLDRQPWVRNAQDQVTSPLALLTSGDPDVTARPEGSGFIVRWPVGLGSSDPDLQSVLGSVNAHLTAVVDRQGVHLVGTDVEDNIDLHESLQTALSHLVKRRLQDAGATLDDLDLIDRVLPLVDVIDGRLSLRAQVDISAVMWGCDFEHTVISEYPFERLGAELIDAQAMIKENATECIGKRTGQQVLEALAGQRLRLFGIEVVWVGPPTIDGSGAQGTQAVLIDDSNESRTRIDAEVSLVRQDGDWRIALEPEFWEEHEDSFGTIVAHRLRKMLGEEYLELEGSRVTGHGYSAKLTLKGVPYLGRVALGRVHFDGNAPGRFEDHVAEVIRSRLSAELSSMLSELGDLPDIGPFQNPEPAIGLTGGDAQLTVSVTGEVPLFGGYVLRGVVIELLPQFRVVSPDPASMLSGTLSEVLSGEIPLDGIQVTVDGPEYGPIPGEGVHGVSADISVRIAGVVRFGARVAIAPDRVIFPGDFVLRLPTPIYLTPVVISEPGVRFNFRSGALQIEGDITVAEAAMAHVAKIESRLGLADPETWTFKLTGDLVAVNSLNLLSADGSFSFGNARAQFRAGTSPMLKSILEAKASGTIDGPGRYVDARAMLRILGVRMSDAGFLLGFPPGEPNADEGRLEFDGFLGLPIGGLNFGAGTTLRLKDPWVQGGIEIDLAGWKAFNGDLWLDLSRAVLNFRALHVKIKVVAPSITNITPSLLLQILANLLKVDLSALLQMKLDEIEISLMDASGQLSEASSDDDAREEGQDGGEPSPGPSRPPEPANAAAPSTDEHPIQRHGVDEGGPYTKTVVCEEVLERRFEFWSVSRDQARLSIHPHKGATPSFHRSTVPSDRDRIEGNRDLPAVCLSRSFNAAEWLPLAPRADWDVSGWSVEYCVNGRLPADVHTRKTARWASIYPFFCGTLVPDDVPPRENPATFETGRVVDHDDGDRLLASDSLQQKVFDEYFAAAADSLRHLGNAVRSHPLTRVELRKKSRLCFWRCDFQVQLRIYLEPPGEEHFWVQSFQLLLHRSTGDYYALTMCDDPAVTGRSFDIAESRYQALCATSRLIRLAVAGDLPRDHVPDLEAHWLTGPELQFLLEDRAGPMLLSAGGISDVESRRILARSFPLVEPEGDEPADDQVRVYDVQQVDVPGDPIVRYVAAERAIGTEVRAIDFPAGNPLLQWMEGRFRDAVLWEKLTHERAELWHGGEDTMDQGPLVLRTRFVDRGRSLETTWFFPSGTGTGTVRKALTIPDRNPYSGAGLVQNEKDWLFQVLREEVRTANWSKAHLSVAEDSKRQLLLLAGHEALKVSFWDIGDGRTTLLREPTSMWLEADLAPLAACLGVPPQQVVDVLLTADRAYRSTPGRTTLRQHPFDIMTRPGCH